MAIGIQDSIVVEDVRGGDEGGEGSEDVRDVNHLDSLFLRCPALRSKEQC